MELKDNKDKIDSFFKQVDPNEVAISFGAITPKPQPNPLNYYSKYWLRIKEGVWEWGREDGDGIEWEVISEELYNNILHLYNIYLKPKYNPAV